MNFQKKALALVLAVLMILSSASALAFAAPAESSYDNVKVNANAIKDIYGKLDPKVETTVGYFRDEFANAGAGADKIPTGGRDSYYHNGLYVPGVAFNGDSENGSSTVLHNYAGVANQYQATISIWLSKNAVFMADGTEAPKTGVLLKVQNNGWNAGSSFDIWCAYPTNKDVNLSEETKNWWYGPTENLRDGNPFNFAGYMNMDRSSNNILSTIPGFNKGAMNVDWHSANLSDYYKIGANTIEFITTFAKDEYVKSVYPEFKFEYECKTTVFGGYWRNNSTVKSSTPVYIINYKPVKEAIVDVMQQLEMVHEYPGAYTKDSVAKLVAAANELLAAKPNNFITKDKGGKAECDAYAAAAKKAMAAYDVFQQKGLVVVPLNEQLYLRENTYVVDFGKQVNAELYNHEVQKHNKKTAQFYGLEFQDPEFVGYTTDANGIVINKPLTEKPAGLNNIVLGKAIELASGTVKIIGNNVYYTPKSLVYGDKADTIYLCAKMTYNDPESVGNSETFYKFKSITFVPADSIYVEDDLDGVFTYNNGSSANWVSYNEGTGIEALDNAAQIAGSGELYGKDTAYNNCDKLSAGSAHKITVSATDNTAVRPNVVFNFTGTGFDVISLASKNTGMFSVEVFKGANADVKNKDNRVKSVFVNTYFDLQYVNGEWVKSETASDTLYQIPAIKVADLPYGTYTVSITPRYSKAHDGDRSGSYDFIFDGVRVYNPANNAEANNAHAEDKQSNVKYAEVKSLVKGANTLTAAPENAIVLLLDKTKAASQADVDKVNSFSPNHEFYLGAGQSVSFKISSAKAPVNVQIGAKKVNGAPKLNDQSITSATDMYYVIKADANGLYTITNNGSGVLSLTNVKCAFDAAATANTFAVRSSAATPKMALAALNSAAADLCVKAQAPVVDGNTITIKATTSLDVDKLIVKDAKGNVVKAEATYTVNGNVKEWTVVIVEAAEGTYSYTISGECAYGYTNATAKEIKVTATIEAAAPQLTFGQKVVNFFKKIFGIKF